MKTLLLLADSPLICAQWYPFTLTKPLAKLRLGIFPLDEWWQLVTNRQVCVLSQHWLMQAEPAIPFAENYIVIQSNVLPTEAVMLQIAQLQEGDCLEDDNGLIAFATAVKPSFGEYPLFFKNTIRVNNQTRLSHPMQGVFANAALITNQAAWLVGKKGDSELPSGNQHWGEFPLIIGSNVHLKGCTLNCSEGPIVIDNDAYIMEGSNLRGPLAIGEGAVIKMGAKLYGGSSIGAFCTAGGEIKNTIMQDFSNKAHDGYLGDSMMGSWCNLGAGTSNSNVKNNASQVAMWHQQLNAFAPIGKKAGLLIGDYSRSAIFTRFNTGTTIGVCCSIHQIEYPNKHVPSFSWGENDTYAFEKALVDINEWMQFKNRALSPAAIGILQHLHHQISK